MCAIAGAKRVDGSNIFGIHDVTKQLFSATREAKSIDLGADTKVTGGPSQSPTAESSQRQQSGTDELKGDTSLVARKKKQGSGISGSTGINY